MKKRTGFSILTALLLVFCHSGMAAVADSVVVYVSPTGDDNSPGTKYDPVASLEVAWQRASAAVGHKAVTIYLREGKHAMLKPFVITGSMSGTEECPVVIAGYPGEKAVLTASRSWQGLSWTPYRDGIWQTEVELGSHADRLFVNGSLKQMARYPDFNPDVTVFKGYADDAISDERVALWKNPKGAYVHAIHGREWGSCHYLVTGKDSAGSLLMEGGFQNNRPMGMHASYRMVENVFEELDSPGEWYYDSKAKKLFYYPEKDLDLNGAVLEVPQSESLFQLKGTEECPVRHVYLRNMSITQTARTFMKTAEPLLRGDWCIYRGAAVLFEHTEQCAIEDCDLYDLGGNAIFFSLKNVRDRVYANYIHHIGGSAVCFVGDPSAVRMPRNDYAAPPVAWEDMDKVAGPLTDNYPMECAADNNLIHDIGLVEKQVAGVQISMSRRISVTHNSIYNLPRAGININDGTWGGHLIEGNDVFSTVLETGDHGAFNSWGRDRFWSSSWNAMVDLLKEHKELVLADAIETNTLCNNRFQCDHGWDIDLDDGSSNYHIFNNICLSGGLKLREGFYRTVENNVILNNGFHPHVWFEGSEDVFIHNIVGTGYEPVSINYWGKEVDNNFFIKPDGLHEAQERNTDLHSLCGNPMFVDADNGDYTVDVHSSALQVGFRNFDMGQFGVQVPKLKNRARQPVLPTIDTQGKEESLFETYQWREMLLKDVATEGERSVAGLDAVRGVWVVSSVANKDGFKPGDVIVRFKEKEIYNMSNISAMLEQCISGETVSIGIIREQQPLDIEIIVDEKK